MGTRAVILAVALLLLATACGTSDGVTVPQPGDPTPVAPEPPQPADGAAESVESAEEAPVSNAAPALLPAGLAQGSVDVGDTTIDYVTIAPADFEIGDTAPLMLAFPPGGQDLALTESIAQRTYLEQAVERGWVVVSPAAPDGTLFFRGAEQHVAGLLDWIETWVTPEDGAPHVVGVSNGGLSAFRYAANHPNRVRSVLTFPGFPRNDTDFAALDNLSDVPIRLFVGETDTPWVAPMTEAATRLEELGADVELEVFPGEGHRIDSLGDGIRIFDTLDALRAS